MTARTLQLTCLYIVFTFGIANVAEGICQEKQKKPQLTDQERKLVVAAAEQYFKQGKVDNESAVNQLMVKKSGGLRWNVNRVYKDHVAKTLKADFDAKRVTFEKHVSPYTVKTVGKKPKNGWPLVIAMHGGGGVPKATNDSQWKHMQVYYKDQKQLAGYKYLALRAPNDTWNGFYDDYVYPLIENLIKQQIVLGDVDSAKVFLIGYSHGGYGAFSIGPKIPHRFAAIHASAAAPTDGQTSAKTLRSTRFSFMVGGKDTNFGRAERCQKFAKLIKDLQRKNPREYPVEFIFHPDNGHTGLPDRNMISKLYPHSRLASPKHLTWEMTDSVVKRFFWLGVDNPSAGMEIDAEIVNNTIKISTIGCSEFSVFLDSRLIKPNNRVKLKIGDKITEVEYQPSFQMLCKTLMESGDIKLARECELAIKLESK
ncbi:MAG: hypothetical protein AAFN77_20360 [Planctomycetota bacterium]